MVLYQFAFYVFILYYGVYLQAMKKMNIYLDDGYKANVVNIGKNRWKGTIDEFGIEVEAKSLNDLRDELTWELANALQNCETNYDAD